MILGLLWGVWHLPLYMIRGQPLADTFFGWTLLGLIPTAILFTWVFNRTRGSLLLALLFHAAIAVTGLFLEATSTQPWIGLVLNWSAALLVIAAGDFRRGPQSVDEQ